jgi:branched-chain amino acid transport system substrate-binding protein
MGLAGFFALWLVFTAGCHKEEPYVIGFVGGLTGRLSDLGTSGRNGVVVAVEHANQAGGVNGRTVELVVQNDGQDADQVRRAMEALIASKAVAVVGPMTSDMALAAVPLANSARLVLISPTASTNKLDNKDDYFLRVNPPDKTETDHLARHAYERMGLRRMTVVYDLSNRGFTEGVYRNFQSSFDAYGDAETAAVSFTSNPHVDFIGLTRQALEKEGDGLFIVAEAVDTAMICQQLEKLGGRAPVFATGWAMTERLIENGGGAVEGVIFSHYFDQYAENPEFLQFKEDYAARFGVPPDFVASLGYNAAQVALQALAGGAEPAALKRRILEMQTFKGVQGSIRITEYGECFLERFILTVRNGRIVAGE